MVDDLKSLLERPIESGVEELRNRFDELFGDLPRENRMSIMLLLSVPYILNENAAIQIEAAVKRGEMPSPGALEAVVEVTVMEFASAVKATVAVGKDLARKRRGAGKKGD